MIVLDRKLFSPLGVFFLIVFGTESIVCLLANGFITVVIGHRWLHSKKMLPCDLLLISLSLSRFLLQSISVSSQFLYFSSPETYLHSHKLGALSLPWIYLNTASLWCATWLNIFYCVKVTTFAHPLFSWLKLRIGVLLPRVLGITLLTFTICSIPAVMVFVKDEKCHNLTGNLPRNTSQSEAHGPKCAMYFSLLGAPFIAISFSTCVSASVALLVSLWRHRRKLKKSGLSTEDFSTQAHLRVMKPLLLSLFFYILHFAALSLVLPCVFKYGQLEWLISDIFMSSYPSTHSVILIYTNPELRKACTRVLNFRRSTS